MKIKRIKKHRDADNKHNKKFCNPFVDTCM